jgi:hypothetical protein
MAFSAPVARSLAIAALFGATFLASPLIAAPTDSANTAPTQMTTPAQEAAARKAETIEQRISHLHKALKITPDEETNWNAVAQAMRDNAAAMEKLVAERNARASQGMTAVEDLKTYENFAQAHVDGLKNLIASFQTLYDAMPDAQKKVTDQVFQGFGAKHARSHH